ncbi:hypothetical protein CS8_054260 [Cupriavidus sp. 8B]
MSCAALRPAREYRYRAVDKHGDTVDFLLRATRDYAAARRFFDKAIDQNGAPVTVIIDGSTAREGHCVRRSAILRAGRMSKTNPAKFRPPTHPYRDNSVAARDSAFAHRWAARP